jgi:hypothetical protein
MAADSAGAEFSFARDIRPLFRDRDQEAMKSRFDLFDYSDVANHAEAIVTALGSGRMPCDGPWPAAQVQTFQHWIDAGKPA